jgi:hypothetical protein
MSAGLGHSLWTVSFALVGRGCIWSASYLTAARRHAGGVATATRAATARMAKMVAFANMVLIVFGLEGYRESEKKRLLKEKYRRCSSNEWEEAGGV